MEKKKFLVIDGSSLFFRAFYALPLLKTKRGVYTNAVYGFISMMENAIDKIDPDYLTICFDQKGRTFRHEIYKEYKGTRQKMPTELDQQWPILMEILKKMNIVVMDSPEYEADDLAGSLSRLAQKEGIETYLLTGDRDYYQLVEDGIFVLMTKKGITQLEIYNVERIQKEYGLSPLQLIDLKGLMGDSSDNIPGVPGIGEKTGIALLKDYSTLEGVYENIDSISGAKRKEKLLENKVQAFMSRKLGEIITSIPLEYEMPDLLRKEYDLDALREMFKEYEFFTLLSRLPEEEIVIEEEKEDEIRFANIKEAVEKLSDDKVIYIHSLSDGKIYEGSLPNYILLSNGTNQAYVIKIKGKEDILALKPMVEEETVEKRGIDLKNDLLYLLHFEMEPKNFSHDASIAEYLLDPTKSSYDLGYLVNTYRNKNTANLEDYLGSGKSKKKIAELEESEIITYLNGVHKNLPTIVSSQKEKIKELNMEALFYDMEMPLVEVLASMELEGMCLDVETLDEIGSSLQEEIDRLTKEIYEISGEEFNLNSPKQLGVVLFENMGLTPIKKTKTGYSTSVEVLEKLREESPIIDMILLYRQLSKINSTYIEGLKKAVNPLDGKVHSIFQQTVAATGRISSTEPNLQNIPIKTEVGRSIRKAFSAGEGKKYVDADYSQIELRILAHISDDEVMKKAFNEEEDIHRTTASQVFHVEKEEVSSLMRSRAKAVNFGIVYGISDYGLSQDLNISRKEAKEYIDNYLEKFDGVHTFMKEIVEVGKEQGYVETLFHRRRYIPELAAKNFSIRSFGERIALNMPIQGTAADMIKLAMVQVYKKLKEGNYRSKLILQVHDELIIETEENELEEVKKLLQSTMENAMTLNVPVLVELSTGDTWYETK
ncbi:DNA polymerase I [Peptoniphilus sp. KCTC 25270]|uniref:DNA polymerase I n=1 Tax=Peptoniphilus sp. KCTC 25270 TaxID=2897414 RepID=UPI001E552178|nr:DNA polymerase I [Peptoniphilus sp. KCTC 25270]MCD1146895.1 DNA polymerase I [Peptoniphilus sp. KCTC 25270]